MEFLFVAAGILAVLIGLVHSVLGEILIFQNLRESQVVPTKPAPPLRQRHIRIIWATWHLTSVFGFAFAAILFALADGATEIRSFVIDSVAVGFSIGALLVLVSTKGRHPGWIGLLAAAGLVWLAGSVSLN